MSGYYDDLETRSPEARESALRKALPAQIENARQKAPAYRALFEGVEAKSIDSRAALAELPVTRKLALLQRQAEAPPFGGFAATATGELSHIFASPGPIFEPEARTRDYWRMARALFAAGQYQEVADMAEAAMQSSGDDYNIYVPITNALGALGKKDARANVLQQRVQVLEQHVRKVPEDARARTLLAIDYAEMERPEDAIREANLAMALRPNEATVLYNVACVFCGLKKTDEAMGALKKAWDAGFKDPVWVRQDPDLASLHGLPEFEELYPADAAG